MTETTIAPNGRNVHELLSTIKPSKATMRARKRLKSKRK